VNLADSSGQFGIPGIVIGAVSGAFGGYLAGIQSGNVWSGIVGGTMGGLSGGLIGFAFPQAGSIVGGMVGGAVAGAFGGAFGGGVGERLSDPNASNRDMGLAIARGAGIGFVTGGISGGLATAAMSVGATGFTADIAVTLVSAPIGLGLGLIPFENGFEQESDLGATYWDNWQFNPCFLFEYDPNNLDEIDADSSATMKIIEGYPPYTWLVSGNGFSFAQSQTDEPFNTLIADDSSCGTATITIMDSCDNEVTDYVRSATGQWVLKSNTCSLQGSNAGSTGYQECIWGDQH